MRGGDVRVKCGKQQSWHEAAQDLRTKLSRYAAKPRFNDEFEEAFVFFFGEGPDEMQDELEPAAFGRFMEWFVHDYRLSHGHRLIELFGMEFATELPCRKRHLLEAWQKSRMTLFEIETMARGVAEARDLVLGGEYSILLPAPANVQGIPVTGRLLVGRLLRVGELWEMPYGVAVFPSSYRERFLQILRGEYRRYKRSRGGDWGEFLQEQGFVFNDLIENLDDEMATGGRQTRFRVRAFFAGVRHFWEQYPKSLGVTESGLEFGLWAEETGQILEVADGFQKTHELVFGWLETDEVREAGALLFQPYVLAFDPEYLAGTRALGVVALPSTEEFPAFKATYEASVEEAYTGYLRQRENRGEYGMQNFGDTTFEWGWGPSYTFWSNQEYDHHYGFLLQYLRAGDMRFWQIGDQAARHYRDVDVIHHSSNPYSMGAPRSHNSKHVVESGWYPDHNLGGVAVHHAWAEGLWLHYLITGDELTHEAARGASDWFAAEVERDRWYRGGVERGPGWALVALMGSYRATSDEKYLQAAREIANDVYLRQDPIRGVYSVPVDGRPSYEGGQSFMSGILARGVARLYVETGDPRAAVATARFYEWLTREMRVDATRFIYKQAPGWHNPHSTDQIASLLAYGLALHDRREDWPMVMQAANFKANSRSMSWMPEALAILERLYGRYVPLEIMPSGTQPIMVGREGLVETTLSLVRLEATEAIEGLLEATEPPAGISISPERVEYRLDAGQTSLSFPVTVHVAPTVAPRRYTLTLSDSIRDEVSVTLPVSVPSWTILDTFRAPVPNTWFGELYSRPTEEQSAGWEHVLVDEVDRLQRSGSAEEYLLYETPGLYDFTLTVYAPPAAMAKMEELIDMTIVSASGDCEEIPWQIAWDEGASGEYAKGVITPRERCVRADVKLKVIVRAGGGPDWPQFERLDIRGWR
jgi:hypothetical protein